MSNYLETLVEKMIADGISEKDIKSVIEEVNNKKSPLNQIVTPSVQGGPSAPGVDVVAQPTTTITPDEKPIVPSISTKTAVTEKDKCEANDMCWDEDRKVCNRCIDEVDDEDVDIEEEDEDIDTEDVDDTEIVDEDDEDETFEDDLESIIQKQNEKEQDDEDVETINQRLSEEIASLQLQTNPNTNELYNQFEASKKARIDEGSDDIDRQVYNPYKETEATDPRELYLSAENINEAQFIPENEINSSFAEGSAEMLENNGDFTLWKTDFIDENGNKKVAVFPNAMSSMVINTKDEEMMDNFYFNDPELAWDHMANNNNYILFNSQEEADEFIKVSTGENGYEGFVSPWDYNAKDSIPSNNLTRGLYSKNLCKETFETQEEILECIYFQTNEVDKEKYPTFERFLVASLDWIREQKEKKRLAHEKKYAIWNPNLVALPYNMRGIVHQKTALNYFHYDNDGKIIPYKDKDYLTNIAPKSWVYNHQNCKWFGGAKPTLLSEIQKDNFNRHLSNVTLEDCALKILSSKSMINEIKGPWFDPTLGKYFPLSAHRYALNQDSKKVEKILDNLFNYYPTRVEVDYDQSQLYRMVFGIHFYNDMDRSSYGGKLHKAMEATPFSLLEKEYISDDPQWIRELFGTDADVSITINKDSFPNSLPTFQLPFVCSSSDGFQTMLSLYEDVLEYKKLQYEGIVAEMNEKTEFVLDLEYNWIELDEDGSLIEVKRTGQEILDQLKGFKSLDAQIKVINTLHSKMVTNNEKLSVHIEELNNKIEEERLKLEKELLEFKIPEYEGDGIDNSLLIRATNAAIEKENELNARFAEIKADLIDEFERKYKKLIKEQEEIEEKLEVEYDEAKEFAPEFDGSEWTTADVMNYIKLRTAQTDRFTKIGLQDGLEYIRKMYTPLIGTGNPNGGVSEAGELPYQMQMIIKQYRHLANEYNAKVEEMWDSTVFHRFLSDTWLGAVTFKLIGEMEGLYNTMVFDGKDYQIATRTHQRMFQLPLDSKFGHFVREEADIVFEGETYTVVSKKGQILGVLMPINQNDVNRERTSDKIASTIPGVQPIASTIDALVYNERGVAGAHNLGHEKYNRLMDYVFQLHDENAIDFETEYNWVAGSTNVAAECIKMYAIMKLTGGTGLFVSRISGGSRFLTYTSQGVFQGYAYGFQTYSQTKAYYMQANPYADESEAETYALMLGITTGLICQLNIEGRIGGATLSTEAIENLMFQWAKGGIAKLPRNEAIKIMSKDIGSMIVWESVEEWTEHFISQWITKTWDQWQHQLYASAETDLAHNDVYSEMTGTDFIEMQIMITCTAGTMGGITSRQKILGLTNASVNEQYTRLMELLEADPDLTSMYDNLEKARPDEFGDGVDVMSEEQYNNILNFLNDATSIYKNKVSPKKFGYTKPEKIELLKAIVLKKDTENMINIEKAKGDDANKEDIKKWEEELKLFNDLITAIENGLYYSEAHGGTTRSYRVEFWKYLTGKFPGLDNAQIADKVNDLKERSKQGLLEPGTADFILLEDLKKKEEQLKKKMDIELLNKARKQALKDGKDASDKSVLNRYKQLIIIEENWVEDILQEKVNHDLQVRDNPEKWKNLLNRLPDRVDKNTTEAEWIRLREACVTSRQRNLISSLLNKIAANPDIVANIYWNGGNANPKNSQKNSYNYNTRDANNPNGKHYEDGGRIINNVMDINMEHARGNVVNHEAAHHWFDKLEKDHPEAHKKLKNTLVEYIKRNPNLYQYVKFGQKYKEHAGTIAARPGESEVERQKRIDDTVTDEMIIEFLADVISGKEKIGEFEKKSVLQSLKYLFSAQPVSGDIQDMDFDQIMNLVADIMDGYSKGKIKHTFIAPTSISTDVNKGTDHQSINPINDGRSYILYDDNNNPIDVGAEINRLYQVDPEGAVDRSSKTFLRITELINLVLERESKKSRGDKKSFSELPGFDLHGFQIASIYGSGNKSYESIYQTMLKFDPLKNDDFFGFIMTKGNKRGVFCPQMLDAIKSGDATQDMFYISLDAEQSHVDKMYDESDLSEVQLPGESDLDPNLIEGADIDIEIETEAGVDTRLMDGINLDQEIIIDGERVVFQHLLDDIVFKIAGTKLPAFDEEVSTNRLKSHPFTTAIFQQAGDKAGTLRLAVQLLMGKGGDAYKNFLINNKSLLINNLQTTYLSKNVPQVVEKFVNGIGWTTDWQGRSIGTGDGQIARYTAEDGPMWVGVTSGPQKMRTIKLEEDQTWDDIISDEDFVKIFMREKDGKYTRIQFKGEGLEYQIAGEIGLATFLDGLKNKKSNISKKFSDISGLNNIIVTQQSIINIENQMRRGDDKESINIIRISKDEDKYNALFDVLDVMSDQIIDLGGTVVDKKQVFEVVNGILSQITDPKNEGKPLFSSKEIKDIAKDIHKLVEKFHNNSSDFGNNVTLPMFINKLYNNRVFSESLVRKYGIVDENNKPIVISDSFNDHQKIMKQRRLPLQMVNEMIEDGTLSKSDAVKLLLKNYKAQYTSAGKIGSGGMIVYNKETKQIEIVSKEKIKGNTQRYQVFNNVEDFVNNVVNKIPGVNVNSTGVGTIDGVSVNIDTKTTPQTVNSKRKFTYQENLESALEARKALMLQLDWLSEKIKEKDSGYTKEDYIMLLMSLKSNMNTILRSAANLKYDIGADFKGKVVYEHMIPAEIVCHILADYHLNPKTKMTPKLLEKFWENYNVAIISGDMDAMLKSLELVKSMPLEWDPKSIEKMDSLIRYYNDLSIGNTNLTTLTNLENNTEVGGDHVAIKDVVNMKEINNETNELKIATDGTVVNSIEVVDSKESIKVINDKEYNPNAIRIFDFDETLISGGNNIIIATSPDGKTEIKIPSGEFLERVGELSDAGYTFNFDDFVNVKGGKDGPMLQKLINQVKRYGPKNIRILTARQPEAAIAIHEWLKTKGINIPIENITGLGVDPNVVITGKDKADIIREYIAKGYTDIEMYDDSKDVVNEVNKLRDEYTIKVEGIEVVENYKESINVVSDNFIKILQQSKGIDPENLPTTLEAEIAASKMYTFSLFPPGSYAFRDFLYKFIPKGKEGEEALKWLDAMLTKPYIEGVAKWKEAKLKLATRYKELVKSLPQINKRLKDNIPDSPFTYDNAVRVYIWNKNGYSIPDITSKELEALLKVVENDPELKTFADALNAIALKSYVKPSKNWIAENIASDISKLSTALRGKFLTKWKENVELMFTEEVRATLLNTYGNKFMNAFNDMLYAMEYGVTKPSNESNVSRRFRLWINNSVGAIMFLNMRSATLQTLSMLNFLDTKNNTPLAAAKVFMTPKYIKYYAKLLKSPHIQARLGEEGRGITEAEIANAIKDAKTPGEKLNAFVAYLLKLGFTPTKIADVFIGYLLIGTTFVINQEAYYMTQIDPNTNEKYTEEDAYNQAYLDFIMRGEQSQQSADPSEISQIQRSNLGILLLSFKNTPMQYARIMLRAADDIRNNRGSKLENLGKIAYYGMLQNFMFVFLQQAVWAAIGDDDEEEATDDMVQSMIDNIIGGLGLEGQIIVTVKNGVLEYFAQEQKGWNADHTYTVLQFMNLSPSIGSKFRKLYSAIKTRQLNRDVMSEMGFVPGNPAVGAIADLISAFTNIPTDRAVRKVNNIIAASSDEYEAHERIALLLGWNPWDLGLKTEKDYVRERLKKEKEEKKNLDKTKDAIDAIKPTVDNEIEQYNKDKKDGIIKFDDDGYPTNRDYYCSGVNSKNIRCGSTVKKPGDRCEWHEDKDKDGIPDYKQEDSKFKQQCDFIKKDNTRCKNTATGDNGRCNVRQHQPDYKE